MKTNHSRLAATLRRLLALALCGLFAIHAPSALAHGGFKLQVTRLAPGSTPPVVDGFFNDFEYPGAVPQPILYRPRADLEPALVRAVATEDNLFLSVSGMAYGPNFGSFVTIAFDRAHNTGSLPRTDDIRFSIAKDGTKAAAHGDVGGFWAPAPELTGWDAARYRCCGDFPATWSVEFRIPIALLRIDSSPFALAYPVVGVHVGQNQVIFPGDDFGWPALGSRNAPNGWGDLVWGPPSSDAGKIFLDVWQISQGLEMDVTGGVAYDKIAGKASVVRAQLFTPGPMRDLSAARCRFQRIAPSVGPVQVVGLEFPKAKLNAAPFGIYMVTGSGEAWIDPTMLEEPGTYHFQIELRLEGSPTLQTFDLGNHSFVPSADLRLLVQPFVRPPAPGDPAFAPWTSDTSSAVWNALMEAHRAWPLRNSVGVVLRSGAPGLGSHGLRVSFRPITECAAGSSTDLCLAEARKNAGLALKSYNAEAKRLNGLDGQRRDLFDKGIVAIASSTIGGGWCCSESDTIAHGVVAVNPFDLFGQVVSHEIGHSVKLVRDTSPHFKDGHSKTGRIPLYRGFPMAQMITKKNFTSPLAAMNSGAAWAGYSDRSMDGIHEGWEWNDLRRTMLAISSSSSGASGGFSPAANAPLFLIAGLIDRADQISRVYSARYDALPLEPTPADPNGSYALVFQNANGVELGRLPFAIHYPDAGDGDFLPANVEGMVDNFLSFSLVTALPPSSARVQIQKLNAVLYTHSFSAQPPSVANVVAAPDPQTGRILLNWFANDPDSQQVKYAISFVPAPGEIPQLLASGLEETSFAFSREFVAATPEGRLMVEASDGYHTARATSNPFPIDPVPPVVRIVSPALQESLVAGQLVTLAGLAVDATDGLINGAALSWSSAQGVPLGQGAQLGVRLPAGAQVLVLTATASSGLSASAFLQVNVLADSDGDGLPDQYEAQWPCMSPLLFDSDQDPDHDGLTSLAEHQLGTNPCNPDSDNDGLSDGDEVRLESHPLNAQSLPPPESVHLSVNGLDFGLCYGPTILSSHVSVTVASPNIAWSVSSSASWLEVIGGGAGDGQILLLANCEGLPEGPYTGVVFVRDGDGEVQPLEVTLTVSLQPRIAIALLNGIAQVSFQSLSGKQYQVERAASLNGNTLWTPASNLIPGTGDRITVSIQPTAGAQFFRVRIER